MLYPDLESEYYPEISKFSSLLSESSMKSPFYIIHLTNHCKTETNQETFIEYTIVTERENKFKVLRRYSDFDWLMKHLYQKYPLHILPPMPPKRIFSATDKFNRKFVDCRQQALERMLQRLSYFPSCLEDVNVQAFLKYSQQDFDLFRKNNKNLSLMTLLQLSIQKIYKDTLFSFKGEESCDVKDESTMECFEIINKRITERSTLMIIEDSMDYLSEESEIFTHCLLWTAQNVADIVLMSENTIITILLDGVAQFFFNWSKESKSHFKSFLNEMSPIIREYVAYDNYIINIIRHRNQTKVNLGLKKKSILYVQTAISPSGYDSLPRGGRYDQLLAESIRLEDELTDFDRIFYPSLEDWQQQKSRDVAKLLNILVTRNLDYHRSIRGLCRTLLHKIIESNL